jgi:hypothetical protein
LDISNARNSVVVNHVRLKFYTSIFGAIIKSLLAKKGIFSMMNFRHSRTLRFDGNDLVEDELMAEIDQRRELDERAMRLFHSIANSIHSSTQMEIDYPFCHGDRKLPILDLKVWISERNKLRRDRERTIVVLHEFFSKEVSSKCVIGARLAIPWNSKRTMLAQEILRICPGRR